MARLESIKNVGEHGECLAIYRGEILRTWRKLETVAKFRDRGENWRLVAKIGDRGEC